MSNKKRKKKLTDKQLITISCGITFVFFVTLLIVIFKNNIFKAPTEKVDWGEISEEGQIEIDEELYNTPDEIDEYTDENGLTYERKYLYSKGISLYLPKNWEANTTNNDIIYISSDKEGFNSVEICITTKYLDIKNPDNLAQNMLYFNKNTLKYHFNNDTFSAPTYAINVDMINKLYDPDIEVWVDTSDTANYTEVETVEDASTGKWEKRNKFLGVTETGALNMFNTDQSANANVVYNFFYSFKDSTEYFISVMSLQDQADKCNTVAETIKNSIEYIEPLEDIYLPSFNNTVTLGNVKFKYPSHFVAVKDSNIKRLESKNFNSKDFGIGISAYTIDFEEEMYVTKDMQNYSDYKKYFLDSLTTNIEDDLFYENINDVVFSYGDEESVLLDNKTCTRFNTSMFIKTIGTEIEVKTEKSFPIYGITYLIQDNEKMHVITITYTEGLQNVAEKYARSIERTIAIN